MMRGFSLFPALPLSLGLLVALFVLPTILPTQFGGIAARADDARPLYIEIIEAQKRDAQGPSANYKVRWRIPPLVTPHNRPSIVFPDTCHPALQNSRNPAAALSQTQQAVGQALYRCAEALPGQSVEIRYPGAAPALSTLIKFTARSGEHHTQLLRPGQVQWHVPRAETVTTIARDYTVLGIQHIWAGWDHLLFIVCLLWIAGTGRRMLITITGFTLAHSVTLALSALKIVSLPVPPVEAAIALSIVFLAVEIAKQRKSSLTWRYPIAVSSSFGLLHGFGFAAALSEIGLPQTELLSGLLFFNVGVEIGQVLFAGSVVALIAISRRLARPLFERDHYLSRARLLSCYGVGGLASLWLVERCVAFV